MYVYEGHMGGFYTSDKILDYDELYCDSCGDSDTLLGWFNTKDELKEKLLEFYGYDKDYNEEWIPYTKEDYLQDKELCLKDIEKIINELWYED